MLEQVMDYIHNYFVKKRYAGHYVISGGSLNLDFLLPGQYYKITGSVFNDGVHVYPSEDLIDESFIGEVWAMAVPPQFIALCNEITEWMDKYGETVNSPYSSESFGGYSYTKANGAGGNGNYSPAITWQDVFKTRLNHWRKLA